MHCHQPTKDCVARRTAEGRAKKEILRCLRRYIAREIYPRLLSPASPGGRQR
jgi:transposase